ncbi:hypothetical protein EDB81DRAFT_794418 [Dactylonectria macrodidyma]|uniref:Uncharacterized protein n=1 Tax=Dactylonectria macrodidyma TaxID=307937 RepID=A0A9P9DCR3_9HYPO|nr:hypothetical protein EDB81DRAFT_819484 [Dactylonectria macrodidyma]KAH7146069.1 hypothetical protein EDB81DRAFT_794418 [Dactylonectria macrodidyma]
MIRNSFYGTSSRLFSISKRAARRMLFLRRSLNADHDEYDHWLSSPDAENEPLIKDPIQY